MFSRRGQDEFGVDSPGAASNQWTGYAALENGLGSSNLALYIFDSFRTAPRLEGTAFGPTVLPRSNTFAVGGQWVVPVRRLDHITPKVEYRLARAAPSPDDDQLEKLGSTFRAGVEYRLAASPLASVVFQAEGLFGEVGDPALDVDGLDRTERHCSEGRDDQVAEIGLVPRFGGGAPVDPYGLGLGQPLIEADLAQCGVDVSSGVDLTFDSSQVSLGVEASSEVLRALYAGGVSPPGLPSLQA